MATLPFGWPCGATLPGFSPGAPARRLRRRRLRGCRLSGVMRTHKKQRPFNVICSTFETGRKADDQGGENRSLERPAWMPTEIVARKVRDVVWGRSIPNARGFVPAAV